jgi:hypothetical protein
MRLASVIVRLNGSQPSDLPRASLRLQTRVGEGSSANIHIPIPLNLPDGFGDASGRVELGDIVVTEQPLADAQIGQPFRVDMCLNRGSAASASALVLLTATKA